MKRVGFLLWLIILVFFMSNTVKVSIAQSGRNSGSSTERTAQLNVIVHSKTNSQLNLNKDSLALFDAGIQQDIEYLRYDPTGARIIVLVDNSQTLRAETALVQKIAQTVLQELQQDDRAMVIGFSEQAEVFAEFTNDTKLLVSSISKFHKQGLPKLYDALVASVEDGFRKQLGSTKRAIVLISDGYDKDSKTKFEEAQAALLNENIIVYAFEAPDRTYGAIRPKGTGPKPIDAISALSESTGGLLFKIDRLDTVEANAKALVKELKENWFTLSYIPKGVNLVNTRRLLITTPDDKLEVRTKKIHPPQNF
jgi:VWFA-related protein